MWETREEVWDTPGEGNEMMKVKCVCLQTLVWCRKVWDFCQYLKNKNEVSVWRGGGLIRGWGGGDGGGTAGGRKVWEVDQRASECRTDGRGLFCWGRVCSQELLLVLECWINHWRVMSAERGTGVWEGVCVCVCVCAQKQKHTQDKQREERNR